MDGYNLIGTSHEDLAARREWLISMLIEYKKIRKHDITVVFDGWKAGGAREEVKRTGGISVIYSRLGETADVLIKKLVAMEKREAIIISSDRDIAAYAWGHDSVTVSSDRFMEIVSHPVQSVQGEYLPMEEEEIRPQKGNPRTLSKKEKALRRVLRKL